MDGGVSLENITGEIEDISDYLDFGFYDRVWFHENSGLGEQGLGLWLGVLHCTGGAMSYWTLKSNGYVVSLTTAKIITNLESEISENQLMLLEFDEEIKCRIKNDDFTVDGYLPAPVKWADILEDDEDLREEFYRIYQDKDIPEADGVFTPEILDDTYMNMEVALPRDTEGPDFACVTKRLKDTNGLPIGTENDDPILDTRVHEVEYVDGHKASLTANAIAQNMFAQVDDKGNRHVLFDKIVDHRHTAPARKQADTFIVTSIGNRPRLETTKG